LGESLPKKFSPSPKVFPSPLRLNPLTHDIFSSYRRGPFPFPETTPLHNLFLVSLYSLLCSRLSSKGCLFPPHRGPLSFFPPSFFFPTEPLSFFRRLLALSNLVLSFCYLASYIRLHNLNKFFFSPAVSPFSLLCSVWFFFSGRLSSLSPSFRPVVIPVLKSVLLLRRPDQTGVQGFSSPCRSGL